MGGRGGEEWFVQLEVNPVPDGSSPQASSRMK